MQITNFCTKLEQALDINEINGILAEYLQQKNITSYAFTYYSRHPSSKRKLKYEFSSPGLEKWHRYYLDMEYEDVDQTLQQVQQNVMPVMWDVHEQLTEAKTSREQELRKESIEFGIDKGVNIPIHGPNEDFATLVLHQLQSETCLQNFAEFKYELFTFAYCYYHNLRKHLYYQHQANDEYQLTQRELQCLTLTASGMLADAIATTLGIAKRTVDFHMQNVNKKLGTKNKYQSVAKALEKHLIVL